MVLITIITYVCLASNYNATVLFIDFDEQSEMLYYVKGEISYLFVLLQTLSFFSMHILQGYKKFGKPKCETYLL